MLAWIELYDFGLTSPFAIIFPLLSKAVHSKDEIRLSITSIIVFSMISTGPKEFNHIPDIYVRKADAISYWLGKVKAGKVSKSQ